MNKKETIMRYGEEAYAKQLEQARAWKKANKEEEKAYNKRYYKEHREQKKEYDKEYYEKHTEEVKARSKKYREEHPDETKANSKRSSQERNRKGGKYYDKQLEYERIGLRRSRHLIRKKHQNQYRPYKQIIAPDSQLHHEWIPKTAEYRGVALVEKDPHQYGIIDVIQILDGEITLLTEDQITKGGKKIE